VTLFGIDGLTEGDDTRALDALIHDRMVETVVGSLDNLQPFSSDPRRDPMTRSTCWGTALRP
jgi:hypothetical protein